MFPRRGGTRVPPSGLSPGPPLPCMVGTVIRGRPRVPPVGGFHVVSPRPRGLPGVPRSGGGTACPPVLCWAVPAVTGRPEAAPCPPHRGRPRVHPPGVLSPPPGRAPFPRVRGRPPDFHRPGADMAGTRLHHATPLRVLNFCSSSIHVAMPPPFGWPFPPPSSGLGTSPCRGDLLARHPHLSSREDVKLALGLKS